LFTNNDVAGFGGPTSFAAMNPPRRSYRQPRRATSIDDQNYHRIFKALTKPIGEILSAPGLIFSEYDGVIPRFDFITHERRDEISTKRRKFHCSAPEPLTEIPARQSQRPPRSAIKREPRFIRAEIPGRRRSKKRLEVFRPAAAATGKIHAENETS